MHARSLIHRIVVIVIRLQCTRERKSFYFLIIFSIAEDYQQSVGLIRRGFGIE